MGVRVRYDYLYESCVRVMHHHPTPLPSFSLPLLTNTQPQDKKKCLYHTPKKTPFITAIIVVWRKQEMCECKRDFSCFFCWYGSFPGSSFGHFLIFKKTVNISKFCAHLFFAPTCYLTFALHFPHPKKYPRLIMKKRLTCM